MVLHKMDVVHIQLVREVWSKELQSYDSYALTAMVKLERVL